MSNNRVEAVHAHVSVASAQRWQLLGLTRPYLGLSLSRPVGTFAKLVRRRVSAFGMVGWGLGCGLGRGAFFGEFSWDFGHWNCRIARYRVNKSSLTRKSFLKLKRKINADPPEIRAVKKN